jgi:two-component system response regulator ChvI
MLNEAESGQTRQPMADYSERDPIRVLHVEDDPDHREAIADQLSDHGFVVHGFADAMSLADGLAVSPEADIILLDWDLPEISGIELLVELRQVGVNLPVVFLTGYGFKAQENLAFERGAVDFIDKARGVEILARRLRRLVRVPKSAAAPAPVGLVVCGKLVLNPNVGRAHWNNIDVDLTIGEHNIVHLLASNVGRWVTYRAIYDRLHYEASSQGPAKPAIGQTCDQLSSAYARSSSNGIRLSPKSKTSRATATAGPARLAPAERGRMKRRFHPIRARDWEGSNNLQAVHLVEGRPGLQPGRLLHF